MKRRVTIHLDDDLYKRVRHRLIDQDMSLSELVSRYLTRYLGTSTKAAESIDTLSPVADVPIEVQSPSPEPIDIRDGKPAVEPFVAPDEASNGADKDGKYVWTLEGFREQLSWGLVPLDDYKRLGLVAPE